MSETAGIQEHRPQPEALKLVFDLEVLKLAVLWQYLFQQCPQSGNIPLAVSQFIDELVLGLFRGDLECVIESPIGRPYAQVLIKNDKRLADRLDDRFGVVLEIININQHNHRAVD